MQYFVQESATWSGKKLSDATVDAGRKAKWGRFEVSIKQLWTPADTISVGTILIQQKGGMTKKFRVVMLIHHTNNPTTTLRLTNIDFNPAADHL